MSERLRRFNIAAGRFFFRRRNTLFPIAFSIFLLTLRTHLSLGHSAFHRLQTWTGFLVAIAGELVRLGTIGFEYIERGGKQGRVHANRLVQKGFYGLTRNPMYVGNLLIATGIVMASGAPLAYVTVIPFFCFVYQAIVSAEEEFLRGKFGREYEDYCARVPRFLPSFRGWRQAFSETRFNWRRPFKQDLSTVAWVGMVLVALPCWRAYSLRGWASTKTLAWRTGISEMGILAFYGFLILLKKQKSPLFYAERGREN